MSKSTCHSLIARGCSLALLLSIAACSKQPDAELQWAQAAVLRNPNVELVAADEKSGMLTLRDKHTGAISVIAAHDLAAAPIADLIRPVPAPVAVPAVEPTPAVTPTPETAPQAAVQEEPPTLPEPAGATVQPVAASEKGYTIERTDGRLKISGPGISVVSAGSSTATGDNTASSHASEPIICEGARMLHLDNRQLQVDGDAITVRGGCELYITNSNIVASGVGVVVHDGTVHISNSYVEGANGSFEADSQAKVFVRGSTFQGLSRRDQLAMIQDQGGNRWR